MLIKFSFVGVSDDNLTLGFDPPAKYKHISMEQNFDGIALETRAEVGLLTRNVVVRGSVQEEWSEKIPACEAEFDSGKIFACSGCNPGDEDVSLCFNGVLHP